MIDDDDTPEQSGVFFLWVRICQNQPVIFVLLPSYYRHQRLERLKNNVPSLTTNQKVVGSNPAGLTKKKAPEAKKNQGSRGFFMSARKCRKMPHIATNFLATTDILPTCFT